jgi:hypothetical protein
VNRKLRALVVAAALWAAFGVVDEKTAWPSNPLIAAPALSDLKSVDELKTLFNQDRGKTRLVLLLSPT